MTNDQTMSDGELIEFLVQALEASETRLKFIHGRLYPQNYFEALADLDRHEEVHKLRGCIDLVVTALEKAYESLKKKGPMEPPASAKIMHGVGPNVGEFYLVHCNSVG